MSATPLSAVKVVTRAIPILRKSGALFKIPARLETIVALNSGLSEFSQVGKFLTVYSRTENEAVALAELLHRATRGLSGPEIPFDARYRKKSLVYYRYGVFRGTAAKNSSDVVLGPTGKRYQDKRAPGVAVPRWLKDPFNRSAARRQTRKRKGPIGVELRVFKAKVQRGKGGVYEALDLSVSPPRMVIIKEGRRHGETDLDGVDGYARIKHEGRVLRALERAGVPVPKVLREFVQNENRYLVLEQIAGRLLIPLGRMQPRQFSWRRAEKILDQLEAVLSLVHGAGWVWRDCKPSHIFLDRGAMRLIDFEGACRLEKTQALPWSSPNYVPPIYERRFSRRAGTLEDDYALGVIAFQFGTGQFPPAADRLRARCYKRTACPDSLRGRIETLLQL